MHNIQFMWFLKEYKRLSKLLPGQVYGSIKKHIRIYYSVL